MLDDSGLGVHFAFRWFGYENEEREPRALSLEEILTLLYRKWSTEKRELMVRMKLRC